MDFKMIAIAFFLATYLLQSADAIIGVNWGRVNAQKILPSNAVDLMLQNGIREARIYSTEEELLRAFAGSGIGLTISITNPFAYKSTKQAKFWILVKKKYFRPSNVRRLYMAEFSFSNFYNKVVINDAIEALGSQQQVLNEEGFGDQIKVTIPQNSGVLKMNKTSLRPSEAEFADEIKPEMTTLVRFLQRNNAPFVFVINSISDIQEFGLDFNFAFVDNKSNVVINDINGAVYTNAFELMYDSFIWALIKLNASDLRVIVGQVGWPTDGYPGANSTMAERYYKSLLPYVSSDKGTPMRPGGPIDIYIQSLTDENRMPVFGNFASFTRHWGIFMSNGRPKYKVDLSGQGRDIEPAESKGLVRMPNRWCTFNGDRTNITRVREQMGKACGLSDCTTMSPGGSCSQLDFTQNVTYAFNMYFQFQYQNETDCDFEGLGRVSLEDPSTQGCIFPVEVVRPEQQPYPDYGPQSRDHGFTERPNSAVFVILFSIFGALFGID